MFQSLEVIGIKELAKALVRFDSEEVLSVRKPRVSNKEGFRGIIDFSSTEQTPW